MASGLPPLKSCQSWQTGGDFHAGEEMRDLAAFFLEASVGVLEYMDIVDEPVSITGCWATLSAAGARHAPVSHPNNFLTGVYCVGAEKGVEVNFTDPRPQRYVMVPQRHDGTLVLARLEGVRLEEGTLALFPAWLEHWLEPSDGQRVTIEFNVMFPTYIASMTRPMWPGNLRSRNR